MTSEAETLVRQGLKQAKFDEKATELTIDLNERYGFENTRVEVLTRGTDKINVYDFKFESNRVDIWPERDSASFELQIYFDGEYRFSVEGRVIIGINKSVKKSMRGDYVGWDIENVKVDSPSVDEIAKELDV